MIAAAVDAPLGNRAVVERTLPDGRAVERDARHHRAQHERVARVQRQFRYLLCGDDTAAAGALGFQTAASAVTSTLSLTAPTSRWISTPLTLAASRVIRSAVYCLKPCAEAVTL